MIRIPPTRCRPRPSPARPLAAVALTASLALAGCLAPEPLPLRPRVYEPVELVYTTTAKELAADLGLRVKCEPGTRTLALEGDAGRIVFVDGTTSMVVAGRTMRAEHHFEIAGESWKEGEIAPMAFENQHIQQVVRATLPSGETGVGVLEQIAFGPHAKYGFKEFLDPA